MSEYGSQSRPVETYRFEIDGYDPMDFTSDEAEVTAESITYDPLPGLSRSELFVVKFGEDSADLTVTVPADSDLAQRCGLLATPGHVRLIWRRYQRTNLSTAVARREGVMDSAVTRGDKCSLLFPDAFTAGLSQRIPKNKLQVVCNWVLGDEHCTKEVDTFEVTQIAESAQFGSTQPGEYFIQADWDDQDDVTRLRGGLLIGTFGDVVESRTIFDIDPYATLTGIRARVTLTRGFGIPLVGSTFTIQEGCDNSFSRCTQLENTARFGGFQFVPTERDNPFKMRLDSRRKT